MCSSRGRIYCEYMSAGAFSMDKAHNENFLYDRLKKNWSKTLLFPFFGLCFFFVLNYSIYLSSSSVICTHLIVSSSLIIMFFVSEVDKSLNKI